MRISKQAQAKQVAKTEVVLALHQLQQEKDLTDIEMFQALCDFMQGTLKYMLRIERHGDPDKPAMVDWPEGR